MKKEKVIIGSAMIFIGTLAFLVTTPKEGLEIMKKALEQMQEFNFIGGHLHKVKGLNKAIIMNRNKQWILCGVIMRLWKRYKLRKEKIELIDRKNYLIRLGFPITFSYGSPINDRLKQIETELNEL